MGLGRCADCGCTDEKPCEGGCSWVNDDHTLCSRCGLARANAIVERLRGLEAPASATGAEVGQAIAQLQLALCGFEGAWELSVESETMGEYGERRDRFDAAYGELTRLFGSMSELVMELLEEYAELAERGGASRIVTP